MKEKKNMIFLGENDRLLFTKGISGVVENGKIILISGPDLIITPYNTSDNGLKGIQEDYNLKFIGTYNYGTEHKYGLNNFKFSPLKDDTIFEGHTYFHKLEDYFDWLRNYFRTRIFGTIDNAWDILKRCPIGLVYGGISDDHFLSQKGLEGLIRSLRESNTFSQEEIFKIIYYYDIDALIVDIYSHIMSVSEKYIAVQKEISNWLEEITTTRERSWLGIINEVNQGKEMCHSSWFSNKIHSMYMDSIISVCSTLDVLTRLIFELDNFPKDFNRPIRFVSRNKYFSDIYQTKIFNTNYVGYAKTIFGKMESYVELSVLRNELVHNCYLSSPPKVYIGKKNDNPKKHSIYYAICFLWDIKPDGKPYRWVNRHRFYGDQTILDDYILYWILKLFDNIDNTMGYVIDYLRK